MPTRLKRYQNSGAYHFLTFSCYRRVAHPCVFNLDLTSTFWVPHSCAFCAHGCENARPDPECYPRTMIRLELQPEIEAQLAAEAHARGLALDRYISDLVVEAAQEHRLDEELQHGLDDIAAGRTRPADEVFAELHERYGIRG